MIRTIVIVSAISAALAGSALANSSAPNERSVFSPKEAMRFLAHQGYAQISNLRQDANGHWHATALKDGNKRFVSIKTREAAEVTN